MASNRSRFSRSLPLRHLGAGKNGWGAMTKPAVLLHGAHVLEVPHPQPAVRHVEEQRVLALDGGLHPGDEQDAQVFGAPAQVFGVDALVVAGEGEDLEALPGGLLEQLDGGVADEVVRDLRACGCGSLPSGAPIPRVQPVWAAGPRPFNRCVCLWAHRADLRRPIGLERADAALHRRPEGGDGDAPRPRRRATISATARAGSGSRGTRARGRWRTDQASEGDLDQDEEHGQHHERDAAVGARDLGHVLGAEARVDARPCRWPGRPARRS